MNSETFLAYRREGFRGSEVAIEIGINYNTPAAVDAANNWTDPGEETTAAQEARELCIQAAAKGVKELILFCFHDQPLGTDESVMAVLQKLVAVSMLVNSDELRVGVFSDHEVGSTGLPRKVGTRPISMAELARQLGCTTYDLRKLQRQFRKAWSFTARIAKPKTPLGTS